MALDTHRKYRLSSKFMLKADGEETLAFDPVSLSVLQLNSSLAHVAKSCDGTASCEQLVLDFASTFALDVAEASREVYRALKILDEHQLIQPAESTEGS